MALHRRCLWPGGSLPPEVGEPPLSLAGRQLAARGRRAGDAPSATRHRRRAIDTPSTHYRCLWPGGSLPPDVGEPPTHHRRRAIDAPSTHYRCLWPGGSLPPDVGEPPSRHR